MSLDTLAEEIAASARSRADEILAEAEAEADEIRRAGEAQAATIRGDLVAKAERESTLLQWEAVAAARQRQQKALLLARGAELDATQEAARGAVADTKLKGRKALLSSLLEQAGEVRLESPRLRPVTVDSKLLKDLAAGWTMGDDVSGLGGFVVESGDGSVTLDCRFDDRLEQAWQRTLPDLNGILFVLN